MSALLDLVAKAISYQKKQAILVATRLKAALQPDALLLAPIVMAGEEREGEGHRTRDGAH